MDKHYKIEQEEDMKKIKAGVIGLGFIGPVHVEAIRRTGNADVVAIAEMNEIKAKEFAAEWGIETIYSNYQDLLKDDTIDVVHICTPNHLHYQITKEALKAGKHVVCEKPLAMDEKEGSELVELAEQTKLICAVNLNYRGYPLVQEVKEMIANGDLGKILAINGSYQQDWLFHETDYSWRLEKEFSGNTRAIADIGSHWFDMMESITGLKTQKVLADFATFHKTRKKPLKEVETYSGKVLAPSDYEDVPIETEDYATVLIRFDKQAHGSFTTNQVAAGRKNRLYFEIYGTKCAVAFDSERPNQLWIGKRDGNNEIMIKDPSLMYKAAVAYNSYPGGHTEGFADATKQTMRNIYAAIRDGKDNGGYANFAAGHRELTICDAIFESSVEEKWTTVK